MFNTDPRDIEFAARQLANTHSHITYEQALEDMQNSADERQGDMQYNMLCAIGAVEVNDFIPEAIIYSPKEEREQKPIEEMSLDELWPPIGQLTTFMQKAQKTSNRLWVEKTLPVYTEINGRIEEWLDITREYREEHISETIDNLDWLRQSFIAFKIEEKDINSALYTIAFELHMEQREYQTAIMPHMAGGDRDLSAECLDDQRGGPERRNWYPSETETTNETYKFKLPLINGEHLAKNKSTGLDYHTDTQRWLESQGKIVNFLRTRINETIGDHKKQAKLLNLFKYCRNNIEKKRKEICYLRFGYKLNEPEKLFSSK